MLRQRYKDYLFDLVYPATYTNYLRWRIRSKTGYWSGKRVQLNLGCGNMYIAGFINIEADPFRRKDMWLDFRHGLPFRGGEVSFIFACHVLEHLDWENVNFALGECHRVLRPSGILRIAVPSLERSVEAYSKKDYSFFPQEVTGNSIGKRFALYMTYFCQHRLMFDAGFLQEILAETGFSEVRTCSFRRSGFLSEDLVKRTDWKSEELERRTTFIEAKK